VRQSDAVFVAGVDPHERQDRAQAPRVIGAYRIEHLLER